jgi:flagellar motor switch protein FliM
MTEAAPRHRQGRRRACAVAGGNRQSPGFSDGEVNLDENSGIRAIIDSAMVSYERLPMLEIVFDRLVRLMTTSLRNFTSDNVEVSLDRITSVRFGDYLNSIRCLVCSRCSRPRSGKISACSRWTRA